MCEHSDFGELNVEGEGICGGLSTVIHEIRQKIIVAALVNIEAFESQL